MSKLTSIYVKKNRLFTVIINMLKNE